AQVFSVDSFNDFYLLRSVVLSLSLWHTKTPHFLNSIPYCLTNGVQFMTLRRKSFSVCCSIVPSPPIRAVISRIVRLFLTASQKPLHEGPERVDELFIRKLCLMFQFPDTEMMEKFSKKLQIVQEKFLVVRSVRWYHYNGLRR
ncbi:MAG: hypothetical protein MR452_09655, partial [Faecalibacterium prausnitzii]|nr:hypothetical protein [Faecalibacterium prausnitzii]